MNLRRLSFAAFLVGPGALVKAQAPRYVVIDLGTLGGAYDIASAINNAGQVTGYSALPGDAESHATLFSAGSVPLDLGTLGGTFSFGTGINDAGLIAGSSAIPGEGHQPRRATLFRGGSLPKDLGTLGGSPSSDGFGINNAGQVVGDSIVTIASEYYTRAALFSEGSQPEELGTLEGHFYSGAFDINDGGLVTGWSTVANRDRSHATLFSLGKAAKDLGTLGGSFNQGVSINNAGKVAGISSLQGDRGQHATLFSEGSRPKSLGTLGGPVSEASGINNSGQIVGKSQITVGNPNSTQAFIYLNDSTKGISDLNKLITPAAKNNWLLTDATAINDAGQVTGDAEINVGFRAFLATPFWRQRDATARSADPNPAVPLKWGYKKPSTQEKSDMEKKGCALCSAASMVRSLIALNYTGTDVEMPIMTPALLDSLLTGNNGYTAFPKIDHPDPKKVKKENYNNLVWERLHTILMDYARLDKVDPIAVRPANLDAILTHQIYTLRRRVVLKFRHFKNGVDAKTLHFVWVIGRDGTDWKVGDGGWDNVDSPLAIESLNAHTVSGFRSGSTLHTFVPEMLYAYGNPANTTPSNRAGETAALAASGSLTDKSGQAAAPNENAGSLDGTRAAVLAIADGPVEVVLIDPQSRRLGHDQATGSDFTEIPDASHWTEEPVSSTNDDDTEAEGGMTKRLLVRSPEVGTYTVAATATAAGMTSVILEFIGPGGGTKRVQADFDFNEGDTSTLEIAVPTVGTADMAVTQSVTPTQAKVGTPLTYTVTVTNNGTSIATAPTFTNVLPDGVSFVSVASSSGTVGLSGTVVGGVLDDLSVGASATIMITVIPNAPEALTNSAHIAGFEFDPDESNNAASLTTVATTSADDWRNLHFTPQELADPNVSGWTADADADGLQNLVEYALNLDPKEFDFSPFPQPTRWPNATGNYVALTHIIAPGVSDVVYTVEASSDLIDWSSAGLETVSQFDNIDGTQTVTVRDTAPISETKWKFLRLKIVKP